MRKFREEKRIQIGKERSIKSLRETLVLQDSQKREFFKFQNGDLTEYDVTKYAGTQIGYSDEEKESIRKLGESNL